MVLNIHCDGSCYHKDKRMGLGYAWFEDDKPDPVRHRIINKHDKLGTSNQAEYLAIINALVSLFKIDTHVYKEILILSDSEVVIKQIIGDFRVTNRELKELHTEVHRLLKTLILKGYVEVYFDWVSREHPRQRIVDKLSKKGNPYFINKKDERVKRRSTNCI